jgi:hypothetical protein
MIMICDGGRCPIFELKGSAFIGIYQRRPVCGLVLKGETELFFDMESELIRSFYELDTLTVTPAVFEVTLIAVGK